MYVHQTEKGKTVTNAWTMKHYFSGSTSIRPFAQNCLMVRQWRRCGYTYFEMSCMGVANTAVKQWNQWNTTLAEELYIFLTRMTHLELSIETYDTLRLFRYEFPSQNDMCMNRADQLFRNNVWAWLDWPDQELRPCMCRVYLLKNLNSTPVVEYAVASLLFSKQITFLHWYRLELTLHSFGLSLLTACMVRPKHTA